MKVPAVLVLAVAFGALAQPFGWYEMASVPFEPSLKVCRNGAWLAMLEVDGRKFVYAAKGYQTTDFHRYDVEENTWQQLETIPWGREGQPPYSGCRGVSDGRRFIYMTKGNNSFGFWRYDAHEDRWMQLPDVPRLDTIGVEMADLAYVELLGRHVFVLWGREGHFCRYRIYQAQWEVLESVPMEDTGDWDQGSFIAYDRDGLLYAHRAEDHVLWAYDLRRRQWLPEPRAPMPHVGGSGRETKSKPGGCGVWQDGSIYALKGGNTCEFWRYFPAGDSWTELETLPQYGSTGRKKRVEHGGHLAGIGSGILYAIKGNKTLEFWRYGPPVGVGEMQPIAHSRQPTATAARGVLMLSGKNDAALLGITGRKVMDLTQGENDVRHLAPGVYFVAPSPQPSPPEGERIKERGRRSAVSKVIVNP